MPDNKPFQPYQPEKKIDVEITVRENQIVETMRKVSFGTFTIHKLNGKLVRIETGESILLVDE